MPYAITNPTEGTLARSLSWRVVADDSEINADEVVIPDDDFHHEWVWDEGIGALRPQTDEEIARAEFEKSRAAKLAEVSGMEQVTLVGLFDEAAELARTQVDPNLQITYGSLKALYLASLPQIEENLPPPKQEVFQEARSKVESAREQLSAMEPSTPKEYQQRTEEIEAMSWESL